MRKSNDELLKRQYVDIEELRQKFLQYAPGYALREAEEAFDKIYSLRSQKLISDGVYYIVLVDLVGSTEFGAKNGNQKLSERVAYFVKSAIVSVSQSKLQNISIFLKEMGDAVLMIFQHFPDILRWQSTLIQHLKISKNGTPFEIRTCIHVGEVAFQGVNPLSLAVSQTFKMEKNIPNGQIGLTEPAFLIAWPSIARAFKGFSEIGRIELLGYEKEVNLYTLNQYDSDDLDRILAENTCTDYY